MSDLTSLTAILGPAQLVPGRHPVKLIDPPAECLISYSFPDIIEEVRCQLKLPVDDCTVFSITHVGQSGDSLTAGDAEAKWHAADAILEQALQTISDFVIWSKTKEQIGTTSAFTRQVGRLDVKCFVINRRDEELIVFQNPVFSATRQMLNMSAGLFLNAIVANSLAVDPVPAIVRRVMSSLDLLNLGFYTEAVVTAFALVDDLVQEIIRAALHGKGLDAKQQKKLLRVNDRLNTYLTRLTKFCGWKSLADDSPELYERLMNVNNLRNRIMHGSIRLSRAKTLEPVNALLDTIDWLRLNPFGYVIPDFPTLHAAIPNFKSFPLRQ
jgi:hypothetical protein